MTMMLAKTSADHIAVAPPTSSSSSHLASALRSCNSKCKRRMTKMTRMKSNKRMLATDNALIRMTPPKMNKPISICSKSNNISSSSCSSSNRSKMRMKMRMRLTSLSRKPSWRLWPWPSSSSRKLMRTMNRKRVMKKTKMMRTSPSLISMPSMRMKGSSSSPTSKRSMKKTRTLSRSPKRSSKSSSMRSSTAAIKRATERRTKMSQMVMIKRNMTSSKS